jgi:NodT family efflux transporter outer membrane factor (OMF) lipoprotein
MPGCKNHGPLRMMLLVGILVASGCMKVGPNFAPPPVEVAKDWLAVDDQRLKAEAAETRTWWRGFDDPLLDELIQTAYRQNLSLLSAGVRVLEARAQLGAVVGEWYPQQQQVFGSLKRIRLSDRASQGIGTLQLGYNEAATGLTASWELDFWGKFRRAIESADASLLAAIADYDNTLVSLTADVATSYILIRTLEKRLDIARKNVEIQRASLQIAEARFNGGTTSERDVDQAKTVLANTQAAIPTLETQLYQAKNALSVLLGMPPSHLTDLLGDMSEIPVPPAQVAVGIPADLLRRRPDIRGAELQAAAQCAQIGVAKAELLPAFSLTGTFGFQASDVGNFALGDMFRWGSRSGSGGPALQWNILNYGQITNLVRVQDARFQQLLIAYQNTVLKAQQEVEDALVAFLRAQERAGFLAESTEAADRSLKLAVLQYREGVTDFTTVLTAQQALLSDQDNLASTLGDIALNLVGTYRALGGGWQIREGQDFVPQRTKAEMAKRTDWGGLLKRAVQEPLGPAERAPLVRPSDW